MDFPTAQDLFTVGQNAIIATPGVRIDPAQINVDGSDINIIVNESSAIGDEVVRQLSLSDQGRYLDSAVEQQVDRLGVDWYDLPRKPATAPLGDVVITRPTNAAGAGTFPAGTIIQYSPTGQTLTLTQSASFSASALTATLADDITTNIPVEGTTTGAAASIMVSNTSAWNWASQPFDATAQISNPFPLVATDAELDAAYKARIRAYFPSIQRGTLLAIENGALTVDQVSEAVADEAATQITLPTNIGLTSAQVTAILQQIGTAIPAPFVQLYISDDNGQSNPQIIGQVQQVEVSYRSAGVYVEVIGAQPVLAYILITGVSVPAGVDPAATVEAIQAAVVTYVNALPPGASLTIAGVYAAAINAGTQATINSPVTGSVSLSTSSAPATFASLDLQPLASGQVFRTITANVTVVG